MGSRGALRPAAVAAAARSGFKHPFSPGESISFYVLSVGCDGSNHQRPNGSFFSQTLTLSLYLLWLLVRWYYLDPPNSPNNI